MTFNDLVQVNLAWENETILSIYIIDSDDKFVRKMLRKSACSLFGKRKVESFSGEFVILW